MADDIKMMSAELARDPGSRVFLRLGETLRRRGEVVAAATVVLGGLERHPDLVDGHDLYARVLVNQEQFERARDVWKGVLERTPRHLGALKGLGFLYFRTGDLEGALDHLELALSVDPTDPSVVRALHTVRSAVEEAEAEPATPEESVFAGLEGAERGMLLVDHRGRVLGGALRDATHTDVSDAVAAYLVGAAQEAERTARLLGLGDWRWIVAEGPSGNVYVTLPTPETLLFILRDRSVPSGRLAMLADKAADIARGWLERQEL